MTTVDPVAIEVERLRAGTPPATLEYRTSGGCGSGRACAGCGAVIPENKMEIEVEFGPESGTKSLALHVKCFSAWLGTLHGGELNTPRLRLGSRS